MMRFVESFTNSETASEFRRVLHVGERLRVVQPSFVYKRSGRYLVSYRVRKNALTVISAVSLRHIGEGTVSIGLSGAKRQYVSTECRSGMFPESDLLRMAIRLFAIRIHSWDSELFRPQIDSVFNR